MGSLSKPSIQLSQPIKRAEKNDKEGNRIYDELKAEYLAEYMPKPDADPHGGIEDPNLINDSLGESKPGSKEDLDYH